MYTKAEESDGREEGCAYYQTKRAHKEGLYWYYKQYIYISVFALFLRRVGTEPHSFRSTRDNDGSNKSL